MVLLSYLCLAVDKSIAFYAFITAHPVKKNNFLP